MSDSTDQNRQIDLEIEELRAFTRPTSRVTSTALDSPPTTAASVLSTRNGLLGLASAMPPQVNHPTTTAMCVQLICIRNPFAPANIAGYSTASPPLECDP